MHVYVHWKSIPRSMDSQTNANTDNINRHPRTVCAHRHVPVVWKMCFSGPTRKEEENAYSAGNILCLDASYMVIRICDPFLFFWLQDCVIFLFSWLKESVIFLFFRLQEFVLFFVFQTARICDLLFFWLKEFVIFLFFWLKEFVVGEAGQVCPVKRKGLCNSGHVRCCASSKPWIVVQWGLCGWPTATWTQHRFRKSKAIIRREMFR